jgi:hypothetical protein
MKYKLSLLIAATFAAFAQAPATLTYGQARSGLFRIRSPLSAEQRGTVAILMAASYVCGKWDANGFAADAASVSTALGTSITRGDCDDVLLTIKSSKGTLVK